MPPLRKLSALEANKYSRLEGAPQLTWYKAGGRGELMLLGDTHPENDDEIIYPGHALEQRRMQMRTSDP